LELQHQLEEAQAKIGDSVVRESNLLNEMKKRGDLARQLLLKKEEELKAVIEGVSQNQKAINNREGIKQSKLSSPSRTVVESESGWEQKSIYLKKAFLEFMKAKGSNEMRNLGRVICAILDLDSADQTNVMENIDRIAPQSVVDTLESFSTMFGITPSTPTRR
jgi:hypothetical protein